MSDIKKDLLSLLFHESKAYSKIDDLEKLVESGQDLSGIPLQPLYLALKQTSVDHLATILPKLAPEQRKALIDLDVWDKDQINIERFSMWPLAYLKCPDEKIIHEFVRSEDFAIFLKARFNIATFDLEEPEYPDDDNYFLTDDNLLIFEFDDHFEHIAEIKKLVSYMYADMGLENAYSYLFKLVNDSFTSFEEEAFRAKKENLRDYGFVDYYDSLFLNASFVSLEALDKFLKTKNVSTAIIDDIGKNQTLHSMSVIAYQQGLDDIHSELLKIKMTGRREYLQFNFIRLVNSSLSLNQAYHDGSLAINRVGTQTKQYLELGFSYVKNKAVDIPHLKKLIEDEGIFAAFDFIELYKVGLSLINLEKQKLKKALSASPFDNEEFEYFLGAQLVNFIDHSFADVVKYKSEASKPVEVKSLADLENWRIQSDFLKSLLPFAKKFFETFNSLKSKNLIHDSFYLNYDVDNIDLESILISGFINFTLGNYNKTDINKMGITISELKKFTSQYFEKKEDNFCIPENSKHELFTKIKDFAASYGLAGVPGVENYLILILDEHLSGYSYDQLSDDEFKHVGGPILLSTTIN